MLKTSSKINQNIITNGCLQIMYINGGDINDSTREPIKTYTEHLDIIIIFDGEISLRIFNQDCILRAGDLFFCTRSTYSEIHTSNKSFSYARLRFIKDKLPEHSIKSRFAASLLESDIIKQKILNHCLSYVDFFNTSTTTMNKEEALALHQDNTEILLVLDIMISQEHPNLKIMENKLADVDLIVNAINLLENDIEKTPKIENVVKQLGVSHSYFVRTFKRYVGATPNKFAKALKINYSLSLISSKMQSLCDISYSLGFTDQSHFCNAFKHHLQLTPGDALLKETP